MFCLTCGQSKQHLTEEAIAIAIAILLLLSFFATHASSNNLSPELSFIYFHLRNVDQRERERSSTEIIATRNRVGRMRRKERERKKTFFPIRNLSLSLSFSHRILQFPVVTWRKASSSFSAAAFETEARREGREGRQERNSFAIMHASEFPWTLSKDTSKDLHSPKKISFFCTCLDVVLHSSTPSFACCDDSLSPFP